MNEDGLLLTGRREAIWLALAAAEISWVTPLFIALSQRVALHPPFLIWLGMLVAFLGFFYFYRALERAGLPLRIQQGVVAAALLAAIGLFLRFHIYTGADGRGAGWLLALFRSLADVETVQPAGWLAMMGLIYLWARALHLARRSTSAESVGFSFRAGVVLFILVAIFARLASQQDISVFVLPYFFFSLVAVALARVDEIQLQPNSSQAGYSGFWIGWTVAGVAGLVLLGTLVAAFFGGGGLAQVLEWLSPIVVVVQIILVGMGALLLLLLEGLLNLLSIDLEVLGQGLREALQGLGELFVFLPTTPPAGANPATRPGILAVVQVVVAVGIPLAIIGLVLLFTWYRQRRVRQEDREEGRESLLSAGAVARNVRAMLQAGLDRLGEFAGLVERFGLGSRFLAAVSVRRIYANLVRLAREAGYPRAPSQTPYEYLGTLYRALPGSEIDVQVITEAYVNAHYGEVPDTRDELQRIRDAWERVRQRGARQPG
jgi:hypothetical protein